MGARVNLSLGNIRKDKEMQALWIVLALIALAAAGLLAYWLVTQFTTMEGHKKRPQQGFVKHDWLPTGRIDFATRLDAAAA